MWHKKKMKKKSLSVTKKYFCPYGNQNTKAVLLNNFDFVSYDSWPYKRRYECDFTDY